MDKGHLIKTAQTIVSTGKGILAADESIETIRKRFEAIGVKSTEESRRDYREMLFRTRDAMNDNISGVILFDETIRQKAKDGTPLVDLIVDAGALPGIKVDKGTRPIPFYPSETITEGLDGLAERLIDYRRLGARFTKWRAVICIGAEAPSHTAITTNCHALARYAAIAQDNGLVPIVEPEVLMDGSHDIDQCYDVTQSVLKKQFEELYNQRVMLQGVILKPNMVISGNKCSKQAAPDEVAEKTLKVLRECVPATVAGIAFLSGGQSCHEATIHLNLINQMGPLPWPVTFSFGRALQDESQAIWAGKNENAFRAQHAFQRRAYANGLAAQGKYLSLSTIAATFEAT